MKAQVPQQFQKYISDTPKVEIVTLNQPLVDWLISCNTNNRNVSKVTVNDYRADIDNGEWFTTGDGLTLCSDMVLANGQHRLFAERAAGYPGTRIVFCYGADPRCRMKIDTHRKRTTAEIVQIVTEIQMPGKDSGEWRYIAKMELGSRVSGGRTKTEDVVEVVRLYHGAGCSLRRRKFRGWNGGSRAVALFAKFHGMPDEILERFIDLAASQEGVFNGDPAKVWFDSLKNATIRDGTPALDPGIVFRLTAECLSAFASGRRFKTKTITRDALPSMEMSIEHLKAVLPGFMRAAKTSA